MLFSARSAIQRRLFDVLCKGILGTPPLTMKSGSLLFLSMSSHRDMVRYLLAIKSIYRRVGIGEVVVVDDGTMTQDDHSILRRHIPLIQIIPIATIDTAPCPKGGTWERLVAITNLCQTHYVIQVDSDTLTLGDLDEVKRCIADNRSFTLAGGSNGARIGSLGDAAALVSDSANPHIQITIEKRLPELSPEVGHRYVRGCSGFAGFARGGATKTQLDRFSIACKSIVGDRWSEWGTEQVASNFLVANTPDAVVLPHERYVNFNGSNADRAAFVHYIGTHRYSKFDYATRSRGFISAFGRNR